jgi:predicted MPP superfamily phosphohydrolase
MARGPLHRLFGSGRPRGEKRPGEKNSGQKKPGEKPPGVARWVSDRLAQLSYAVLVEPTWLEVNRLQIELPGVELVRPFRVVQISDLHYHGKTPQAYLKHIVQQVNSVEPDLVALTGDYIHGGGRYIRLAAEWLGQLRARHGVLAVLGNHDHAIRASWSPRLHRNLNERVSAALAAHGIRVLHNELVVIEHGGERFQVSGVDDLWSRQCRPAQALAALDEGCPHIMLAHHPLTIHQIEGRRCDLMLSGHTHGGQVHSERYGSVTLSKRMRHYAAGLYTFGPQRLYVNKGVGYGWRIRYNRRPEIAVFDFAGSPTEPERGSVGESDLAGE